MGENLFKQDRDFDDSHSIRTGRVTKSHRRRSSSSSLETKSRTSRGVVNRSSDSLPRRSRSKDKFETGITSGGKLYRKNSHGDIETSTIKTHTSRHRSRSGSRDRKSRTAGAALGATIGSSVIASTSRHRSRSPQKAFVRSKHGNEPDSSELASVLRLHDSESHNGRRGSRHSPDSKHLRDHKGGKKSRGFFSFSNGSSSSSNSSNLAFGVDLERKSGKATKTQKKDQKKHSGSRDADAALLGLGAAAAALALNQSQRSKHKGELIAVKESKGKGKPGKHGHNSKKSSSNSSEDQWESASEGEWSSADSELAYGASLRRRSQESLSSDSSGLDKWGWRWGSKKAKKPRSHREQPSRFDHMKPGPGIPSGILDSAQVPSNQHRQDSRMTSSSSVPLQYVYPMPTSDPTQYDVARHDSGTSFHQSHMNGRPDPVPIQHPQPVAPVSQAVYTTQTPYVHSYSAPVGPPMSTQYPYPPAIGGDRKGSEGVHDQALGAFPTGSEYFETFVRDSNKGAQPRRRDSSPVTRTSDYVSSSSGPQRRKSLKDESSSVRFDLTKEQEDKDRREERRRKKEDDKRRERRDRQEIDERKMPERDLLDRQDLAGIDEQIRLHRSSSDEPPNVKKESWAAPAAAGVIAAAIGATVASEGHSKTERRDTQDDEGKYRDDRDIEVIVKERHASGADPASRNSGGRNGSSKEEAMSIWQAAAKLKRTSSHTDYAAYFTPPELLSKSSEVKCVAGANADNDITVYQVPHVVTVEPSEPRGRSSSRAYSFPITAESSEDDKKHFPWSVPQLNLVEPTPPSSRTGSIAGSRSPRSRSPLSGEVPVINIPLEPLESVTEADVTYTEPDHVEYTVIEPKGHREPSIDSPTTEINISESIPGISSLKNRNTRKESPSKPTYEDDLDFAATVAAGLQDTGFNPSIVIDNPSFRRRDSPPGSEEDSFRRGPTAIVTEITAGIEEPRSPPHGFVEEIPEHHMPGSFDQGEERKSRQNPELQQRNLESAADLDKPNHATAESTKPSDNMGASHHIYEVEPAPIKSRDLSNAVFDPVASSKDQKTSERKAVVEEFTEPADNARVDPKIYSAKPEPLDTSELRDVTIEPVPEHQRSMSAMEENTSSSPDKIDYPSDEAPSVAVTAPVSSSGGHGSKSKKKSKRRSVGFEDTHSVFSAPATFEDAGDSSTKPDKTRKGGIFGLFSKSTDNVSEPKGSQETPVEANLEDFEEPKKRSKKSKNRRSTFDDERDVAAEVVSTGPQEAEGQDDWNTSKRSKRGKEKRRSTEGNTAQDSGRITQDLPAQVIAPASPGQIPLPPSSEMLTDLEDPNDSRVDDSRGIRVLDDLDDPLRAHHNQEPSFLGERPEKPPLPDLPDASEDPGGQLHDSSMPEKSVQSESQSETPTKADKQKWRLSDIQSDGRSVSYSSPSPTAVPFRPLRFGRRPSSPGLAKSLPSTPQPSTATDLPMTPRRRERPHSTEFKSNEFRPIWLLEKHGSRQEPAPQESYPSLPSSHTTSRASSVHEADDLTQAEDVDLGSNSFSDYQIKPGRHGLAIDTSLYAADSGLLDSQQATPTATSFQSMLKEGGSDVKETGHESSQPRFELIDAIPPADAYVDPTKEPDQDERLLHGVDDLFPQRRSNSPSRYGTVASTDNAQQPENEEALSEGKSDKKNSGITAMIKDAALGAFIGGSAAALLKSTSEHDEHLGQSSNDAELERQMESDPVLTAQPVDTASRRPAVEETRLIQQQDTQDAVDSWFAPAQPKRTKSKKGKKRAESPEISETLSSTDPPKQASKEKQIADVDYQVPAASDERGRSILDDAALTAEPDETGEAPQSELSAQEVGAETTSVDWQTALTTRKDSKGKKEKKSKKGGGEFLDEKTILPDEPTTEQLPEPSTALEGVVRSKDSAVEDTRTADLDVKDGPGSMRPDVETSREAETSPVAAAVEEFHTSTKKNKKSKKKSRQSFQAEPSEAANLEEPKATASDIPAELPRTPVASATEDIGPDSSLSEAVPYKFPSSEEMKSKLPNDLPWAEQPPSLEADVDSERMDEPHRNTPDTIQKSVAALPAAEDLPLQDAPEGEAAPIAEVTGREPLQIPEPIAAALQTLPKNIPLPSSNDFDLAPSPPVIQPVDAALSAETPQAVISLGLEASGQKIEPATVPSSSALESPNTKSVSDEAPTDSNTEQTILTMAISELNLPEKAIEHQHAEFAEGEPEQKAAASQEQIEGEWLSFGPDKSKKEEDSTGKSSEADTGQDAVELRFSKAEGTANRNLTPTQGLHAEEALPNTDVSGTEHIGEREAGLVVDRDETSEQFAKASLEGIEEEADWPTATKKKEKAKKGKKVQFDQPDKILPQQPEASTARELPSATTSTAEDIGNLLHATELEEANATADLPALQEAQSLSEASHVGSENKTIVSHGLAEIESVSEHKELSGRDAAAESLIVSPFSTPTLSHPDTSMTVMDNSSGDINRAQAEEYGQQAGKAVAAGKNTAAEVQSMLAGQGEPDAAPVSGQDAVNDAAPPAEPDDFSWAPKKKKKGKKSKSADEAVARTSKNPEDIPPEVSMVDKAPIAAELPLANEPVEEFSAKKSKKDKKSKRKGLSRSASDLQEEESPITPMVEDRKEEMALSNDAPSILEKTDQLPPIELPMSPKVADTEVPSHPVAGDGPLASVEAGRGTNLEEMETTAKSPSITEQHDELPSTEMPTSPQAVLNESSVVDSDRPGSASTTKKALEVAPDELENTRPGPLDVGNVTIPAVEDPSAKESRDMAIPDVVLPESAADDQPQVEEPPAPLGSADSVPALDRQTVDQPPKDEVPREIPATAPEEEAVFQPPISSKNKKKAKKAKGLQWEEEIPASELGQTSQHNEIESESAKEPTSEAVFEAPTKSKKDKKKAKKAKALDWPAEELPGSPIEPSEMAKLGSKEPGSDTVIPEAVPLLKEAVIANEISGDTTMKEATVENAEKLEASAEGGDRPMLSSERVTGPDENPLEIINPTLEQTGELVKEEQLPEASESLPEANDLAQGGELGTKGEIDESKGEPAIEQPIEPAIEDSPAMSEASLKSKKDKKKAKKLKAGTWEDDLPSTSTGFEDPQQEVIDVESKTLTESIIEPLKSKKDKKKSKKNKLSAWEEEAPIILSAGETQREILPAESNVLHEPSKAAAEARAEEAMENPLDEQAPTRKGKKKGKKSNFAAWDEESSIPSSRDEADQQLSRSIEEDILTQPPGEDATKAKEYVDISDFQATLKKGKKKGKKSKLVAWDEEPSIPSPSDEKEQSPQDSESQPAETGLEAPPLGKKESKEDVEESVTTPGKKKDKKKTKKSRAYSWEEEALPSASQDLAHSDVSKGPADRVEEPVESSVAKAQDMDETVPGNELEPSQDVDTIQNNGPQAEPMPPPSTTDEASAAREVTSMLAEEPIIHEQDLHSMILDSHPEPVVVPPTDNVEITDASLQAVTEDIEVPEGSCSIKRGDDCARPESDMVVLSSLDQRTEDHPDTLVEPSDVRPKPISAPTIDDALKTTEEVILSASSEGAKVASPMPEIIDTERSAHADVEIPNVSSSEVNVTDTEQGVVSSTEDPPKVVGETIPSQSDEVVELRSPVPELTSENPVEDTVPARTYTPDPDEEIQPITQEQVVSERKLADEFVKQPAISAPAPDTDNIKLADEFPSISKKDKKKAKKAKKAMALEDEALEQPILDDTVRGTEAEAEPSEVFDREAAEESPLPAGSTNLEADDEVLSTSRKDKKKAKKNKKSSGFDQELSESTTPAELELPSAISSEKPALPEDSGAVENVDDFAFLSKKDKKKAKKAKKGTPYEDEPSAISTPAEPELVLESNEKVAGESALPTEADVAKALEEFPAMGKKDKKKAKKSKKSIAFDEELSGTATPTTPVAEVDVLDRALEEPSVSGELGVVELVDGFSSMSKKDKKAKKGKKASVFGDEPAEPTTPAEAEAEAEPSMEVISKTEEEKLQTDEPSTLTEEAPAMNKNESKKGKKVKKDSTFDDGPSESTTPAEPETIPELLDDTLSPAETKAEPIIDNTPLMSSKDRKKAKKAKKALAFDDDLPSESITPVKSDRGIEVMDQTGEGVALPIEASAPEAPQDALLMTKKDKKKAKKGKKSPVTESEDLEIAPTAEETAPVAHEPAEPLPNLPSLDEPDHDQIMDPPIAQEASPRLGTLTETTDKAVVEDDVPVEAEPDLLVSSKKSKKDKKKAKKGQAFNWDEDEVARESPADELATEASAPSGETQVADDTIIEKVAYVPKQLDFSAPKADTEQTPAVESSVSPILLEHELAPRHQPPSAVIDNPKDPEPITTMVADQARDEQNTTEMAAPAMAEKSIPSPTAVDESTTIQELPVEPRINAEQPEDETTALPAVEEAPANQDDEFSSFVTTKKSKKGKKSKKQSTNWEEEAATTPPISAPSRALENESIETRPEMAAWPTEVRLNQSEGPVQAEEQPSLRGDIAPDPATIDILSPIPEPVGPPPVVDERSDYFDHAPNPEESTQTELLNNQANVTMKEKVLDSIYKDPHPKAETSNPPEEIVRTAALPEISVGQDEQEASTAQSSDTQNVTAEPADDIEGFVSKKKDKKSKRKQKKQVVDDVMWEFPTTDPPILPSNFEAAQHEDSSAPMGEPNNLKADREDVTQENSSREIGAQEKLDVPLPADHQSIVQPEPTIPEEPQLEKAAEDAWGSAPKKSKKGKKSKKTREATQDDILCPQPTRAKEQEAVEPLEEPRFEEKDSGSSRQSEYRPSEDQQSATPSRGISAAINAAAALGAGAIAAEQLGRKDSKKGKKSKKSRQASGYGDEQEQEQESQPIVAPSTQDVDQPVQSRASTPERRRSPIQAWHQYISPSQSPKQSELYEIKEGRPASTGSTRRKRSHNKQIPTPERRSPIEAWHQYNTPRHSPQQSETFDYKPRQAEILIEEPALQGGNRDSAVHVSDSPIVPRDYSPIHRGMRDSGYPDTEASPIVGSGGQYQERSHEDTRESQRAVDILHNSKMTNPLNISSEGQVHRERGGSRTPPNWGSEQQNVNLPRHTTQPKRSFDDLREPSPVSSTTRDRSSVLFESSPSTREAQISQEERKRSSHHQDSPTRHAYEHEERDHEQDDDSGPRSATRPLVPEREDNSAVVNARAESLAALSGLRPTDQGQQRPSIFGGPIGVSSDGTLPETPLDHDGSNRRRLNTITEYSPEESPLHKKNRDLSDVGSPDRGVKTARRSGTPQAVQKRRASPSPQEPGKRRVSADDAMSGLSLAVDEDNHLERSRSRGTEQRPSSHQSNISSLVSSQPKQREYERRSLSGASNRSIESINAIIRTPPDQMRSASGMSNRSSGTPPLRRSDRSVSGDLRGANRKSEAKKRAKQPELESENTIHPPSITPHDSTNDSGKSRVREMADVFEGYGDFRGSPISPTRPPSMRRRQSMQVLELESKLDQLVAENRSLHDARQRAERNLDDAARDRDQEVGSYRESIQTRDTWLQQKDAEIAHLNETLGSLQSQVAQLTQVNECLHAASRELGDHQERYGQLEEEHADTHQRWQQSTRELEALRDQHARLSTGMEDIVRHEVNTAVEEKNIELRRLSDELDSAKQQIRTLQQQILASKRSQDSIIPDRDEDYFDAQCQSLCQHVQQWVLRFSKFSDNRACYLASEIRDEKIVDRMENAILDGSDPDDYLADRVKRRDVFMSMVMTMTWEFIFTRYLFGADREQRQKLKSLEKQLSDSPNVSMASVHKWRAITLALLSKREQFVNQRSLDTEAVMHTIFDTLAKILPPPTHLVLQIQQSLRKVLAGAVDLSVEMRTQRAEYVMLPPLQPEYDTNGDLARKVYFNAALMNERSGMTGVGNEELEARRAVVRMVLFPLVVRKGDAGQEGEEIVVCPAQVLVAGDEEERGKGKRVRVMEASEQGDRSDVGMVGGNVF
ncbi:MAG: hypothetical protein L6R41_005472 [Letrouitia leprolyta]|nr:MAG: hypothetical protein L6R41_005472 [Letrouitia leprolyta]